MSGPIFVFTAHRSGGTALARLLNCHPDVLIWGEHAGFINKLAELDATLACYRLFDAPLAGRGLEAFAAGGKADPAAFEPWTSPLERGVFRTWCRDLIERSFRPRIAAGRRWGFKEVRYHTLPTARFLADLFPDARFVLLRRELAALTLSNMLAPWSIDRLREDGATATAAGVREAVFDCAFALTVIDQGLEAIAGALPGRCRVVTNEALRQAPEPVLAGLFGFLDLPASPALLDSVRAVLGTRVGATDLAGGHGLLNRVSVERLLPQALAEARAAIAAAGPDLARLRRCGVPGRYSYLVGDHELWQTPYSATF